MLHFYKTKGKNITEKKQNRPKIDSKSLELKIQNDFITMVTTIGASIAKEIKGYKFKLKHKGNRGYLGLRRTNRLQKLLQLQTRCLTAKSDIDFVALHEIVLELKKMRRFSSHYTARMKIPLEIYDNLHNGIIAELSQTIEGNISESLIGLLKQYEQITDVNILSRTRQDGKHTVISQPFSHLLGFWQKLPTWKSSLEYKFVPNVADGLLNNATFKTAKTLFYASIKQLYDNHKSANGFFYKRLCEKLNNEYANENILFMLAVVTYYKSGSNTHPEKIHLPSGRLIKTNMPSTTIKKIISPDAKAEQSQSHLSQDSDLSIGVTTEPSLDQLCMFHAIKDYFISIDSKYEINLPERIRTQFISGYEKFLASPNEHPLPSLFPLYQEVYKLVKTNHYFKINRVYQLDDYLDYSDIKPSLGRQRP